jgi:hypothetical protein
MMGKWHWPVEKQEAKSLLADGATLVDRAKQIVETA